MYFVMQSFGSGTWYCVRATKNLDVASKAIVKRTAPLHLPRRIVEAEAGTYEPQATYTLGDLKTVTVIEPCQACIAPFGGTRHYCGREDKTRG